MDTNINHWTPLDSRNPVAHDARIAKMKKKREDKMRALHAGDERRIKDKRMNKKLQTIDRKIRLKEEVRMKQQARAERLEKKRKAEEEKERRRVMEEYQAKRRNENLKKSKEKAEKERNKDRDLKKLQEQLDSLNTLAQQATYDPTLLDKIEELEKKIKEEKAIKRVREENEKFENEGKEQQDEAPPPAYEDIPTDTLNEAKEILRKKKFATEQDNRQLAVPIVEEQGALSIPDDEQKTDGKDIARQTVEREKVLMLDELQEQLQAEKARRNDIENEISQIQAELKNVMKQMNEERDKNSTVTDEYTRLGNKMENLEKDIRNLTKILEKSKNKIVGIIDKKAEILQQQSPQASMDDLHPFVMKPAPPQLHMQKLHMQTSMEKVELAEPAMETLADDVHVQAVQPMKCKKHEPPEGYMKRKSQMKCSKHEPPEGKMKRKSHEAAGDILEDGMNALGKMFGGKKKEKKRKKAIKAVKEAIFSKLQCDSCGELHDGIHDCEVQALVKMLDGYDSEGTALEKPRCPTMGIASRKMHEMNINDVL